MYVLAIDTSSPAVTAGVVLVDRAAVNSVDSPDGPIELSVAAERASLAARGHGELLSPAVADCLTDAGITPREIGAVVAGVGPGPFTGLRVGLVTAAAFADAVGVPTYGVCSLDAIALEAHDPGGTGAGAGGGLLVATDARRREVYWAHYDAAGVRVAGPAVALPADVPTGGLDAIAGAAGELYADEWPQLGRTTFRYPSPQALVELAADRITGGAPGETLEPLYLRRPDAVVPGAPKTVTQGPAGGPR